MNRAKNIALASALALGLAGSAFAAVCPGPDAFGHECTVDPAGACTFLPTSTVVNPMFDDNCVSVNLPFTFTFYGNPVNTVGVASNGYLLMSSCAAGDGTDFTNDCPIPSGIQPNNAVYGVWDDLRPSTGQVTYGTSGAAPDRVFAVTYNNVPFWLATQDATFQIQLHENGGAGEKAIVSIQPTSDGYQGDFTSGLENSAASDGLTRLCNPTFGSWTGAPNCTEYSPAPPATGECDLTEIEAKLDDEFRFTDDDELREVRDEVNGQLAALEAKLDDLTTGICDVVRLLHTPSGIRTADCGGQHYEWNDDGTVHD